MSFNLLKLKKKQDVNSELKKITVDHLIVGFLPKSIFNLVNDEKNQQQSFLIIDETERTIMEHLRVADALPYPWFVDQTHTNEENAFPSIEGVKFFKDGELRSFQSRFKLNACHKFLSSFQNPRLELSWTKWWTTNTSADLQDKIKNSVIQGQIKTISFNNDVWVLETFDNKEITAKRISWNLSPELFLKLFHSTQTYPKKFLDYCASIHGQNFLLLQLKLTPEQKIDAGFENCLIPLLMGADDGYFMVTKDTMNEGNTFNIAYVFDEHEISEGLVAQKIKQIKKQFKKIVTNSDHAFMDEKVWFLPNYSFTSNTAAQNFLQEDALFTFDPAYNYLNSDLNMAAVDKMKSLFLFDNSQSYDCSI